MDEYIITYRGSKGRQLLIHPDWIALAERVTKDAVIRGLKKHLWEPGEYTAEFLGWKASSRADLTVIFSSRSLKEHLSIHRP